MAFPCTPCNISSGTSKWLGNLVQEGNLLPADFTKLLAWIIGCNMTRLVQVGRLRQQKLYLSRASVHKLPKIRKRFPNWCIVRGAWLTEQHHYSCAWYICNGQQSSIPCNSLTNSIHKQDFSNCWMSWSEYCLLNFILAAASTSTDDSRMTISCMLSNHGQIWNCTRKVAFSIHTSSFAMQTTMSFNSSWTAQCKHVADLGAVRVIWCLREQYTSGLAKAWQSQGRPSLRRRSQDSISVW